MPTSSDAKPLVVFDFVRPPAITKEEVLAGRAPGEALLGFIQLQLRGWRVESSHSRWQNRLGALRHRLAFRLEIPSFGMLWQWRRADVVVVATRISLVLALVAKLLGKPLLFLDAMCGEVPGRPWKRWALRQALKLSDACLCLSQSQAVHWAGQLKLPLSTFTAIPFGLDQAFYRSGQAEALQADTPEHFVVSVGRDPSRDFTTFLAAVKQLNLKAKLVTKPYLLPSDISSSPSVEVLDGLSYPDLFGLYGTAIAAIVPVKSNTTFMSGIRATMEAMLVGAPVVLAKTPGMLDYFAEGEEVLYYEPEDAASLAKALRRLIEDDALRARLTANAARKIKEDYSLERYLSHLEKMLRELSLGRTATKVQTERPAS